MRLTKHSPGLLIFFLLAAYALYQSVYMPFHNWDIIGYIAAAKSFEEQDFESLQSFTYEQLRQSVPASTYEELILIDSYRQTVSKDVTVFKEQLPFYQIRPVYTGLIYLLYKAGVNIGFATHIISGVAVVVAIAFLYLISVSFLAKQFIYAVPPLAVIFGVLELGRFSTPDGLAFLAVILSAYLYLKNHITALLIILPVVLGIRTDLILFTIPLALCIFVLEKNYRRKASISMLISVAVYISIETYWNSPGWATTFYFTQIQILTHPISAPPVLTVQNYFSVLYNGIKTVIYNKPFILFILIASYSLYFIRKISKAKPVMITFKSPSTVISGVCLFFVVSHFLAFPVIWDRFFTGQYLIVAVSGLIMMSDYFYFKQNSAPLSKRFERKVI